ncbi:MAG: hypothetical protein K2J70_02145 [Muribaculaceae bacterium]|nr:hypothetical protein [Muribaculaceae bacterium]
MKTKIMLPKALCEMEAVKYVAFRYGTTPECVLEHYFIQSGLILANDRREPDYILTPNEMALFHDLGIHPSMVEII